MLIAVPDDLLNIVYDTDYSDFFNQGGFVDPSGIILETEDSTLPSLDTSPQHALQQEQPGEKEITSPDLQSDGSSLLTVSPGSAEDSSKFEDVTDSGLEQKEVAPDIVGLGENPSALTSQAEFQGADPSTLSEDQASLTDPLTQVQADQQSSAEKASSQQEQKSEPLSSGAQDHSDEHSPSEQSDHQKTQKSGQETSSKSEKVGFFEKIATTLFGKGKPTTSLQKTQKEKIVDNPLIADKDLKEQVKYILELPDDQFSTRKITQKLRHYILETEKRYNTVLADYKSHIAPSFWKVDSTLLQLSGLYAKSYYMQTYPSYLEALWTRDILSFHGKRDMSFFVYPEDDSAIQTMLKQKATQLKAEINEAYGKGITIDTEIELQYRDVDEIRKKLATREERYYETGYYTTLYDEEQEKLKENTRKFEQKIAGLGMRIKPAVWRMDEGLVSSLPLCIDQLGITRSTITSSLAGSFPFISQDMLKDSGILYGINQHTGGLVIFDRFNSDLPNMNSVVLATSGAGKSFTVKLEVLRYLLNNIDTIVIDPENEYEALASKVGGSYINVSTGSQQFINPFDLPPKIEDRDYGPGDLLRGQIMDLLGMISILVGGLTPQEESILDTALQMTYQLKGITLDTDDYTGKRVPLMGDLYNVLQATTGAEDIAIRLSKYVTGSFSKIFNNYTNVDIDSRLTVFSIRDLEDSLKTPAMYSVLNFIWSKVRSQKKKRLLVCDEAWIMLQHERSSEFLFGLVKRARKYGLGITTISQDIEDFMRSKYGKPIVSNSSLQILLKQSTSSIKTLEQIVGLSDTEKQKLIASSVGEGLLFAGNQHIALRVLASPQEKDFITTNVA